MEPTAEWATAVPAAGLAGLIERYVGYRLAGHPAGVHRGLPSRHMTFIVSIGPAIDVVAQTDPNQVPDRYGCVLSGLQARPALIAHDGYQEGVAIDLTPLGARALAGLPAGALWNTSLESDEVLGPAGRELWERLQGSAPWAQRFAVCDEILLRLVGRAGAGPGAGAGAGAGAVVPELRHAWEVVVGSGGTASVTALSAELGWSRQHLARRFTTEFGLGPKLAARVVRFERARHMLQSVPSFVTIAQVAATCGYYDQAHLNRDFAEMAGCSPRSWLIEEQLPLFQDDHALAV